MKITLLLLAACCALALATPIQTQREKQDVLVNRPRFDALGTKQKRDMIGGVKGGMPPRPIPLEYQVTKGEYVCGDKICKLTPGVEPPGCNGMCQYPL
ncbi:uncharacterized protein LOC113494431 isoform X2 [Trichoplusia ni]|uniref:Uncharacterized protein LOC113494431 isoform X2 n=1 Tax=Trichoplusia ni TaxID=7111 RepID=A0A7E5VJU2_TRINI|nr:uncharacterized protein LOC113494431 isoform X2 [Trichoplusia ni]